MRSSRRCFFQHDLLWTERHAALHLQVIEPIDARLGMIAQCHVAMRERELLKVDFDARYRKLKLLKEQGASKVSSDPTLLPRKEDKLRRTAVSLQEKTDVLFRYVPP